MAVRAVVGVVVDVGDSAVDRRHGYSIRLLECSKSGPKNFNEDTKTNSKVSSIPPRSGATVLRGAATWVA